MAIHITQTKFINIIIKIIFHDLEFFIRDRNQIRSYFSVFLNLVQHLHSCLNLSSLNVLSEHTLSHQNFYQIENTNENSSREKTSLSISESSSHIYHCSSDSSSENLIKMCIMSSWVQQNTLPKSKQTHPSSKITTSNRSPSLSQ